MSLKYFKSTSFWITINTAAGNIIKIGENQVF